MMDARPGAVEGPLWDPPQSTQMEIRGLTKDQISRILKKMGGSKVCSVPLCCLSVWIVETTRVMQILGRRKEKLGSGNSCSRCLPIRRDFILFKYISISIKYISIFLKYFSILTFISHAADGHLLGEIMWRITFPYISYIFPYFANIFHICSYISCSRWPSIRRGYGEDSLSQYFCTNV